MGDAAFEMITEIRRQFKEIPGLLEGTGKPDNGRCVEIATTAALKRMVLPGAIAIFAPVVIGFSFGAEMLGGLLGGGLLSCVLLALTSLMLVGHGIMQKNMSNKVIWVEKVQKLIKLQLWVIPLVIH